MAIRSQHSTAIFFGKHSRHDDSVVVGLKVLEEPVADSLGLAVVLVAFLQLAHEGLNVWVHLWEISSDVSDNLRDCSRSRHRFFAFAYGTYPAWDIQRIGPHFCPLLGIDFDLGRDDRPLASQRWHYHNRVGRAILDWHGIDEFLKGNRGAKMGLSAIAWKLAKLQHKAHRFTSMLMQTVSPGKIL